MNYLCYCCNSWYISLRYNFNICSKCLEILNILPEVSYKEQIIQKSLDNQFSHKRYKVLSNFKKDSNIYIQYSDLENNKYIYCYNAFSLESMRYE